jgi:hypothetical protein
MQIADRFHLYQNLLNAVKEALKIEVPNKIEIPNDPEMPESLPVKASDAEDKKNCKC